MPLAEQTHGGGLVSECWRGSGLERRRVAPGPRIFTAISCSPAATRCSQGWLSECTRRYRPSRRRRSQPCVAPQSCCRRPCRTGDARPAWRAHGPKELCGQYGLHCAGAGAARGMAFAKRRRPEPRSWSWSGPAAERAPRIAQDVVFMPPMNCVASGTWPLKSAPEKSKPGFSF